MCPPDYYGIEYEINPWMDRRRQADRAVGGAAMVATSRHCWNRTVRGLVPDADQRPARPGVYGQRGLIYRRLAVPARFRHPQRQKEEAYGRQWLAAHGFQVRPLESEAYFEGAGDALFCGDTLFAGYRIRSDVRGHQEIGQLLGLPRSSRWNWSIRATTTSTRVSARWRPAWRSTIRRPSTRYARDVLRANVADLIPVNDEESRHFACNAVVLGQTVITNSGCPELHRELRARGFVAEECPLGEFVKAGGSAKCLTLRLDGEEAAAWKLAAPVAHASKPSTPPLPKAVGLQGRADRL